MISVLSTFALSPLATLLAPFRRARAARADRARSGMDAATYAAMVAEAERIAAPYRQHIDCQLALLQMSEEVEEMGGNFPEVAALLERAGLLSS